MDFVLQKGHLRAESSEMSTHGTHVSRDQFSNDDGGSAIVCSGDKRQSKQPPAAFYSFYVKILCTVHEVRSFPTDRFTCSHVVMVETSARADSSPDRHGLMADQLEHLRPLRASRGIFSAGWG